MLMIIFIIINSSQILSIFDINIFTVPTTTSPPFPLKSDLGGPCRASNDCRDVNAVCLNGVCTCGTGYYPKDNACCK